MTFPEWWESWRKRWMPDWTPPVDIAASSGWNAAIREVLKLIRDGAAYHVANAADTEIDPGKRLHSHLIATNYAALATRILTTLGQPGPYE